MGSDYWIQTVISLSTSTYLAPFICSKVVFFLESEFRESIFRYLAVLWKMNWKTLSSVCLCYGNKLKNNLLMN